MKINYILGLIFLLGLTLRVVLIDKFPIGFTPDEASFGYDAYSLLLTGRDQWGHGWPLVLESFGDYKLPLYTYLAIPSVYLFGLSEFSTRLPNAVLGSLAIIFVYLLTNKLFKNSTISIIAAILVAISPWHTSLSRGAFEANLTSFFLTAGFWAFLKGLENARYMIVSSLLLGLNLFTYHSARLTTVLFSIILLLSFWSKIKKNTSAYYIPIFIAAIFSVLVLISLLQGAGTRAGDVSILSSLKSSEHIAGTRYQAILLGLPENISKVFSNKYAFTFDTFISQYLSYFSVDFLFSNGAREHTYGMVVGFGVLYFLEIVFMIFALVNLSKAKDKKMFYLLISIILLSPIPAALTRGPGGAANRAATMIPFIQILSAFGAYYFYLYLKDLLRVSNKILIGGISLVTIFFLASFLEKYFFHLPIDSSKAMLEGRKEAVEYALQHKEEYTKILFSKSLSEPHIYIAFYTQLDPAEYQKYTKEWNYREVGLKFVDQQGQYNLDRYTIGNIEVDKELPGTLLIGKPEEFSKEVTPKKIITSSSGEKLIYIVSL